VLTGECDEALEDWDSDNEEGIQESRSGPTDSTAWEYAATMLLRTSTGSLRGLLTSLSDLCSNATTTPLPLEFPEAMDSVDRLVSIVCNIVSSPSFSSIALETADTVGITQLICRYVEFSLSILEHLVFKDESEKLWLLPGAATLPPLRTACVASAASTVRCMCTLIKSKMFFRDMVLLYDNLIAHHHANKALTIEHT
jgi:hypothetical protein